MRDDFPEMGLLWNYENEGIYSAEIHGFLLRAAPVSRDLEYGFRVSKLLANEKKSYIIIGSGHCDDLATAMTAAERVVEDLRSVH